MADTTGDRATRAEVARKAILDSGDAELIRRLYLLEAATPPAAATRPAPQSGPGLLGTGLAVAGGAWIGTVLGGLTLSGEMQEAFAAVAEDLGIDLTGVDMAAFGAVEAADPALFEELGLGDIADDLGAFFDI
jgi:hypothetical protein